ncbi:MAG: transmembrane anchor protein [Patescibacteria group bacterium]
MNNSHKPTLDELPSSEQLKKSTKRAGIIALVILVTIVLPAEYGIDILRVGRVLGLTEMGEIKQSLQEEAQMQEEKQLALEESMEDEVPSEDAVEEEEENSSEANEDSLTVTIAADGWAEVKVDMSKDSEIEYTWKTEGGALNYNVHGESSTGSNFEYDDGRDETEMSGTITAAFDGTHGWFWRNRTGSAVTVTISVEGAFKSLREIQ